MYYPAYPEDAPAAGIGLTFATGWRYVQIMSDEWAQEAFAIVWNDEKQALSYFPIRTNPKMVEIDYTPEAEAKVRAWIYKRWFERLFDAEREAVKKHKKGSVVRVVRGKTEKGLVGPVVVVIQREYNNGAWKKPVENKYGIAKDDEKVIVNVRGKDYENYKNLAWVWARNVELDVVPAIEVEEIEKEAQACVDGTFAKVLAGAERLWN